MALPSSGQIAMSQINTELSFPATTLISLNQADARALAGVPAGMISLSDFYGKSTGVAKAFTWSFWGNYIAGGPANGRVNSYDIWQCDFATETISLTPTVYSSTLWYGGFASTADKAYQIGGGAGRPIPTATISNRVDTISYSTITISTGVATTAYPIRQSTSGYDTSSYIYTLSGITTVLINTGFRTNITTGTSSPTTTYSGVAFSPQSVQGIRDANKMIIATASAPPSPSPYIFVPFDYATQTYGAALGTVNRTTSSTSTRFINTKTGYAYATFGGLANSVKYNLTTFTNVVSAIVANTPTNPMTQTSNFNEGTNWVQMSAGLAGPTLAPKRYKLTFSTDTFVALPNTPLIFGTNNTASFPANCDQPISYSY
jgi:hypothetical protein